jgi:hypothetical protein
MPDSGCRTRSAARSRGMVWLQPSDLSHRLGLVLGSVDGHRQGDHRVDPVRRLATTGVGNPGAPLGLLRHRGYPSISFLYSAAEAIFEPAEHDRRTAIYYLGDHDPSGRDIDRAIRQGIGESLLALEGPAWPSWFDDDDPEDHERVFSYYADFERIAVTAQQISAWNLPTRPTKMADSRSKNFHGDSVELDAIPSPRLRQLAEQAIERHVDPHRFKILRIAEEEERKGLEPLAASFGDLGPQNGEAPLPAFVSVGAGGRWRADARRPATPTTPAGCGRSGLRGRSRSSTTARNPHRPRIRPITPGHPT